jgi:hypothetical protein
MNRGKERQWTRVAKPSLPVLLCILLLPNYFRSTHAVTFNRSSPSAGCPMNDVGMLSAFYLTLSVLYQFNHLDRDVWIQRALPPERVQEPYPIIREALSCEQISMLVS